MNSIIKIFLWVTADSSPTRVTRVFGRKKTLDRQGLAFVGGSGEIFNLLYQVIVSNGFH
jgi:hypothetical protein